MEYTVSEEALFRLEQNYNMDIVDYLIEQEIEHIIF